MTPNIHFFRASIWWKYLDEDTMLPPPFTLLYCLHRGMRWLGKKINSVMCPRWDSLLFSVNADSINVRNVIYPLAFRRKRRKEPAKTVTNNASANEMQEENSKMQPTVRRKYTSACSSKRSTQSISGCRGQFRRWETGLRKALPEPHAYANFARSGMSPRGQLTRVEGGLQESRLFAKTIKTEKIMAP